MGADLSCSYHRLSRTDSGWVKVWSFSPDRSESPAEIRCCVLWFAYRVYGLNGRKKLIGGALALPIALLFCHGVLSVAWIALHPRKLFNYSIFRVGLICF